MTLDEILRELQATHDEATIDFAADALSQLEIATEHLSHLLRHRYLSVRRAAVLALGKRHGLAERGALEEKLADANGLLRKDAARALGLLGDAKAIPPLQAAVRDPKAFVRAAAAEALASIGGRTALETLDARSREERDGRAKRAIVDAIARLGQDAALSLSALSVLASHVAREDDPPLREHALGLALALARGRRKDELVDALRHVPTSGRTTLANALAEHARELDPALAGLVDELRAEPPDAALLAQFGSDLSGRARRLKAGRTYGREREIELVRSRLQAEGPRSVILVGPSGAGKSAVIQEVSRRLAAEPRVVPTFVHEVTTGDILAGTSYLGEWQTRLNKLIQAVRSPSPVVWYSPDVNRLVDAGRARNSDQNFASMLAPYLERGEIAILGESTPEALRGGIERDPPFRKLFQVVHVDAMSPEATLEVLGNVARDLAQEAKEQRGIELEVLPAALALAEELGAAFFPGQARPGSGLRLLRETVQAALEGAKGPERVLVTAPLVTKTLASVTGIPELLMNDELPLDLGEVRRFFSERVLGQPDAVAVVTDLITLVKAGLSDPNKPLGVFFFVGPTGVGKTEMAKALAEFLYGSPDRLVRLDMADYKDPLAFRRLTGDPNALEPAARSGALTAPVHEKPFSVVLLDEIEKAHPNVFDLLLPLMDDGRLSDDQGRVTDFRRTIVIMTSNVASDMKEDLKLGFSYGRPDTREKVERVMEEHFRPEWLNRLDRTVIFQPLTLEVMRKIARREVGRVLARRGISRRDIVVDVDDSVTGLLLKEGFSDRYGARPLKRRVEQLVLQPLARALVSIKGEGPEIVRLRARGEHVIAERIGGAPPPPETEEESRALPRVRDPRDATRRLSVAELEKRAQDLASRIEALDEHLASLGLRRRKDQLLGASHEVAFWDDPLRARTVLAEIAALEKALDAPARLKKRFADLQDQLARAVREGARDPRLLTRAAERWDELARDVEFSDYAARCREARDRGDAFLVLKQVGDAPRDGDLVYRMASMYLRWAQKKGLGAAPVLESLGPDERVRECSLRIEGVCAFGLLRGEEGLHQWIDRRGLARTDAKSRDVSFVRVSVLAPAPVELREDEVRVDVRPQKKQAGKLMKRHRVHLVLTHDETMVAVEGASERAPSDAIPEARAVLAARVAEARSAGAPSAATPPPDDPLGRLASDVVRRYVLSGQAQVRDLASGLKAPLESVLEGDLDDFVARRLAPAT